MSIAFLIAADLWGTERMFLCFFLLQTCIVDAVTPVQLRCRLLAGRCFVSLERPPPMKALPNLRICLLIRLFCAKTERMLLVPVSLLYVSQ